MIKRRDFEMDRIAYLLERIAKGQATEHDIAELAVLRYRQDKYSPLEYP